MNQKRKIYLEKKKLCMKYPGKYNMDMCLARKKGTGSKRCRRKAILGSGRCKLHGGLAGMSIKHGKYSKYFKNKFLKMYEYFRRDPKILELKDEVAILRALGAEARTFMDSKLVRKNPKVLFILRDQMSRLADMVGKNIERIYKIKSAVISIEAVPIVIKQLVSIIADNLGTCPHCKASLGDTHREMYSKMLTLRLPTLEWPKQKDNDMLEAEYKVLDNNRLSDEDKK